MAKDFDLGALDRELEDFAQRLASLNTAREHYPDATLGKFDAALAELGLAEEELRACREELASRSDDMAREDYALHGERQLLSRAFQALPFPAFLLDRAGTIERANRSGAGLLASRQSYLTGKPLPVFIEVSGRAAFRSHLSAVLRDGTEVTFDTAVAHRGGTQGASITLSNIARGEDAGSLVLAVLRSPTGAGAGVPVAGDAAADDPAVGTSARVFELINSMTRLLLDERSLHEPVAQRRVVRLLAREYADWAIIDIVDGEGLVRAAVAGSAEQDGPDTSLLENADPASSPVVRGVLETGNPALDTATENHDDLGVTREGFPLLLALRAASLICVPLRGRDAVLGTLTLVRGKGLAQFDLSDLGVIEAIGEHLALAVRSERSYQRQADVAEVLQASLLPKHLPDVPGFDIATRYRAATEGTEVGGDFYDAFHCGDGLRCVVGDVCGKGEEAAAATAIVRHGVRTVSTRERDPVQVLWQVNQSMATYRETSRFVTAAAADLTRTEEGAQVRLASAGHLPAVVVRADGTVHAVDGGGMPLGLFPEPRFDSEEVLLGVGDLLLLYSDGVTEARTQDGPLYGQERLYASLARCHGQSAAAVLEKVTGDIDAHANGSTRDDITLLAVRVEDGASG